MIYTVIALYADGHGRFAATVETEDPGEAEVLAQEEACRLNNWSYKRDETTWYPGDEDQTWEGGHDPRTDQDCFPDWDLNIDGPLDIAAVIEGDDFKVVA